MSAGARGPTVTAGPTVAAAGAAIIEVVGAGAVAWGHPILAARWWLLAQLGLWSAAWWLVSWPLFACLAASPSAAW